MSSDTVKKLIVLGKSESVTISVDTSNLAVTVVFLFFLLLRSYAVNVSNINWKCRGCTVGILFCGSLLT